ncbi:MAG: WG repeat-containing protein, partial [Bacteroidales bacterium]|nr:WG repeat-containing protein [Bacteroidales bacterium]
MEDISVDSGTCRENYKIKRTIDEVLDMETGEIIKSEDFFEKPESELFAYRRRLQEAITGIASPKFVCAHCMQLVKLLGRKTQRGKVSFFAHLYDSDDCEIKTNGELTKKEIEARKYFKLRESNRHIELKNKIAHVLQGERSQSLGVENVEIEKQNRSSVPYLCWRQPDISAEFEGKKIVFELQLSTTFLSVVVDRDIFYRLNNIFILWIFNFSENQEYVNLSNMMCKDIYYANKRNAFVFDEKAQQLSEEEGQLVLHCFWFEPRIENGVFEPEKNDNIKEKYVRLSELNFDYETYKPYYVDADDMFFKYQPELKINRIEFENININRIKKMERNFLQKHNGKIILPFEYDDIGEFIDGKAKVKKNGKYGYIDEQGNTVIPFEYDDIGEFIDGKAEAKKNYTHGYIDEQGNELIENPLTISEDLVKGIKFGKYGIENKNGKIIFPFKYDDIGEFIDGKAKAQKNGKYGYIDEQGNTVIPFVYDYIEEFTAGKAKAIKNYTHGYIDEKRKQNKKNSLVTSENSDKDDIENKKEKVIYDRRFKAQKNEKYGYVDVQGNTVIPFVYDEIGEFIDGKAKVKKNGKYGYIDEQGNELIEKPLNISEDLVKGIKFGKYGIENKNGKIILPFEYDEIGEFIDGRIKAKKNGKYGYIDEQGNELIENPLTVNEDLVKGIKFGKYGIENKNGKVILPFKYDEIGEFIDGKAKVKKNRKYGYIDEQGNTVIPFEYNYIGEFIDGRIKAQINGKYGYIDEQGNTVIPFEYNEIGEFIDGRIKAQINGK